MSYLEKAKRLLAAGAQESKETRYRAPARRAFHLASLGPDADLAECDRLLGDLTALADDLALRART
jgi:hypothetical protein